MALELAVGSEPSCRFRPQMPLSRTTVFIVPADAATGSTSPARSTRPVRPTARRGRRAWREVKRGIVSILCRTGRNVNQTDQMLARH